ncbi:SGNH/GDSL hydrolase family protein [Mesobacillus subterraneus]|uniref:SGNH/GDSL hydrolase family protein n=1 Tax=Mesobacillus subterraneus TaxID=285983 RepID=UPI00203F083F|nr:SGNH/GDSL hydrolase family protein [Mesobacillus subterraneus]MCM3664372.1 SGNH/GDSL hydrolase family protein [Mesobacillus subterraneus]MCM3682398.1 SGNH/GDSL hydrolase family protein [Mesobacillus subterraneus]
MKKKLTLLYFCLAVLLVSCSQIDSLQKGNFNKVKETGVELKNALPDSFFPKDLHIVAAGDSLTQGVGDSTNSGGYIPYLADQLEKEKTIKNANFENFGVRGNRADQLLARLESKNMQSSIQDADLIILTIGGNDLMKVVKENFSSLKLNYFKAEEKVFEENLQTIFSKIRIHNPEAPIILIGLYNPFYNWFADVKEMNQIVDEWNGKSRLIVENDRNAYFVDIHDIFLNNEENLLYTDYFHPNDRGYQLIADRVYEILDQQVIE